MKFDTNVSVFFTKISYNSKKTLSLQRYFIIKKHIIMPVKIRLSRHGKKGYAFYHIVAADSRAPRDGKYIERLGSYNPNTHPATIELNFERALTWLNNGAQPTETCRNILSQEGVLLKKHLLGGVKKGAFSEAEAKNRFEKWIAERQAKIDAIKNEATKRKNEIVRKKKDAEVKAKEAIAKKVAEKMAAAEPEVTEPKAVEPTVVETVEAG